ncbi:MAG: hypothetical protein ACI4XW_12820, partial [Candidatus Spyradocola sp.]
MNFKESTALNVYSIDAEKQFNEIQNRLSRIDSSFNTRMNGKTSASLTGSLMGTLAWLVVFVVCAIIAANLVHGVLLAITMIAVLGLITFMLIDNITDFSYYGNIAAHRSSVTQLQYRVRIGRTSIRSNHDAFMASRASGWNFALSAGASIPEEAASIEATMANMESLKKGFVNSAKNFFFYAAVVMVTITGCVALFPAGSGIITGISGTSMSADTLTVLNVIALLIVGVGEVILANIVWSRTDCNVTNTTLFVMAAGPITFLALIAIATLLIVLIIGLVSVVLAILGIIVVGALAIG